VEGRSRAAVDDTTLADSGDSTDSGDSADEFLTYDSAADVYQKIDFGTPSGGSFSRIFEEGTTRHLQVSQREPKRAQGRPKASRRQPKTVPRSAKGAKWAPQ